MATERDLLAAIAASPDEPTRLVYADWLLAQGDRRGELIHLDHKERTTEGGLTSPDQAGQLLRLAAEFGFPHLPDPDAELLAIQQIGRENSEWRVGDYTLRRRGDALELQQDHGVLIENRSLALTRRWTDPQTNAILTIVLRVIQNRASFESLVFPAHLETLAAHRLGPLPMYYSAEVLEDFEADWLLRARDHARWYAIYDRMMKGYSRTSSFKAVKPSDD